MTLGQQVMVMPTLMLTSKGVAGAAARGPGGVNGDPRQFNLPLKVAAILPGIDSSIMDMGRTAVNVMGNCLATVVVARWEGVRFN